MWQHPNLVSLSFCLLLSQPALQLGMARGLRPTLERGRKGATPLPSWLPENLPANPLHPLSSPAEGLGGCCKAPVMVGPQGPCGSPGTMWLSSLPVGRGRGCREWGAASGCVRLWRCRGAEAAIHLLWWVRGSRSAPRCTCWDIRCRAPRCGPPEATCQCYAPEPGNVASFASGISADVVTSQTPR